ncbi:MAG: cysteine peptidase family C39 domain-containing protein [Crocinitomicaceae bacterium]|nr:cysteine peptidase family C39 domain-containing protein [Crocinitomicaceae bacterium]
MKLRKRLEGSKHKYLFLVTCFLLAIPGFSMATYYFHLIESPSWYITFRSISNIEWMNSFIGLFLGVIEVKKKGIALLLSVILITIPYAKPILRPINVNSETKWIDDVCIQSTYASCGPSSLATIFKLKGIHSSEAEIATSAFTCSSGTEIWYLLRHASNKGLNYSCKKIQNIQQVQPPCIIGTKIHNIGHFITVLRTNKEKLLIGDPLIGKIELTNKEFLKRYKLDGLMIYFH